MNLSTIIQNFELYVDDLTELSTAEETTLANKIYHRICADRPWEFLKTSATGTLSTSVPYVSLAADFSFFVPNTQYSDSVTNYDNSTAAVLVGANYTPYRIVNWSDRRQYRDQQGYAYLDLANSRLYFTKQPSTAESFEYDYIKVPADLTASDEPVFPDRFHAMIYHGMAIEDDIIQRFDKARSYAGENAAMYKKYLDDMAMWNARLQH